MAFTKAGRYDEVLLRNPASTNAAVKAVTDADVWVYEEDGSTLATLYTDSDAGTEADNPVSPDSNGNLEFFANPGQYVLKIYVDSVLERTDTVIVPPDPDELEGSDVVSVTDYGATGDGSTDDADAIIDAIAAAVSAESPLYFPAGDYKITKRLLIQDPLHVFGESGSKIIVAGNSSPDNRAFVCSSDVDQSYSFSGTVSAGDTTVTIADPSGLSAGDIVHIEFGDGISDPSQPFLRMWTTISGVSGTTVTLDGPVPEDVSGTSHTLSSFTSIAENIVIERLEFDYTYSSGSPPAVYVQTNVARNVRVRDLYAVKCPRFVSFENSENCHASNLYADEATALFSAHYALTGWGSRNCGFEKVTIRNAQRTAIYFESGWRGGYVRDASIEVVSSGNNVAVYAGGESEGLMLENIELVLGASISPISIQQSAEVETRNWTVRGQDGNTRGFPLTQHHGRLHFEGVAYQRRRQGRRIFRVRPSETFEIELPDGKYAEGRVLVSSATGITAATVKNGSGDSTSILGSLSAGAFASIGAMANIGSVWPVNTNDDVMVLEFTTDGTVPDDAYGVVEFEFFDPAAVAETHADERFSIEPMVERRVRYADAAPTDGTWVVGDRVVNRDTSSGGPDGWVCVTAGTPGTWVADDALSSAMFDVRAYGATGDGVTDDTAAIQAAHTALAAAGGGVLFFPEGTYLCSSATSQLITTSTSLTIKGAGRGITTLKGASADDGIVIGAGGFTAEDITFDTWSNALVVGNAGAWTEDIVVQRCDFTTISGRAMVVSATTSKPRRVRIRDCNQSSGIGGFTMFCDELEDVRVEDCTITDLTSGSDCYGIGIGRDSGSSGPDGSLMRDVEITGNTIKNLSGTGETHAILAQGQGFVISGNTIDTIESSGGDCEAIYTKSYPCVVSDNVIIDGGSDSGGAIQAKGYKRLQGLPADRLRGFGVRIVNNHIYETRSTSESAFGIAVYTDDCIVMGNLIHGCSNAAIYLPIEQTDDIVIAQNDIIAHRYKYAILVRNDANRVVIDSNRIRTVTPSGTASVGIELLIASASATMDDIIVVGNVISGLGGGSFDWGVELRNEFGNANSITNVTIRDNIIRGDNNGLACNDASTVGGPVYAINNRSDNPPTATFLSIADLHYVTEGDVGPSGEVGLRLHDDVVLYRDAANSLRTPDSLHVDTNFEVNGTATFDLDVYINEQVRMADGTEFIFGGSTGTKFGTASSQRLGFYGATPITRPGATSDIKDSLVALGLITDGGATPLDLDGGDLTVASTDIIGNADTIQLLVKGNATQTASLQEWQSSAGSVLSRVASSGSILGPLGSVSAPSFAFNFDSDTGLFRVGGVANALGVVCGGAETARFTTSALALVDGRNIEVGATTGTKIALAATDKIGFYGATPVAQQTAPTALTDSSGGTTDGTIAAVTDTTASDQSGTINDNFAELAEDMAAIRTALVNLGLIA